MKSLRAFHAKRDDFYADGFYRMQSPRGASGGVEGGGSRAFIKNKN